MSCVHHNIISVRPLRNKLVVVHMCRECLCAESVCVCVPRVSVSVCREYLCLCAESVCVCVPRVSVSVCRKCVSVCRECLCAKIVCVCVPRVSVSVCQECLCLCAESFVSVCRECLCLVLICYFLNIAPHLLVCRFGVMAVCHGSV